MFSLRREDESKAREEKETSPSSNHKEIEKQDWVLVPGFGGGVGLLKSVSEGMASVVTSIGQVQCPASQLKRVLHFRVTTLFEKSVSKEEKESTYTSRTEPLVIDDVPLNLSLHELRERVGQHYGLSGTEIRLVVNGYELQPKTCAVKRGVESTETDSTTQTQDDPWERLIAQYSAATKTLFDKSSHEELARNFPYALCDHLHSQLVGADTIDVLALSEQVSALVLDPSAKAKRIEIAADGVTASLSPFGSEQDCSVRAVNKIDSGKVYWDVLVISTDTGRINFGVSAKNMNINGYVGQDNKGWSYYGNTGKAEHNSSSKDYGPTFTTGDVIRVKLDMDNRTLSFCKNGVDLGVAHTDLPKEVWPTFSLYSKKDSFTVIKCSTF